MSESPANGETRDELYARLVRERYGDPAALSDELTRHVPDRLRAAVGRPRVNATPHITEPVTPPRIPAGAGRYADDHKRVLRWVKRSHPDWRQELCVFGAGGVAHVVTSSGTVIGYSLCGKRGEARRASDEIPVCRVCTA